MERENQSQSVHYRTSLFAQKISSSGENNCAEVQGIIKKKQITCVGVGTVAVTGTGVLGVAIVEAAEGWGLELGTGCVEEGGLAVL